MFDEILKLVKDHIGNNLQVASAIPEGQAEDVHNEIAAHINDGLKNQVTEQGGVGGLLSQLTGSLTSGSPVINAIEGGLVGSLGSKFGLSSGVTGAIAAALPGVLQKFANKANDPNDASITPSTITQSIGGGGLGGALGSLFR